MNLGEQIIFDIFVMFVGAKIGGWSAARLGQPTILGELVSGIVIGPHALGLVGRPSSALVEIFGQQQAAEAALHGAYRSLAELGLIFLLFYVGLETRLPEVLAVGRRSLLVAVLGVSLPFLFGYGSMRLTGWTDVQAMFVGAALVATSTGVTARILRDLGMIHSREARIILGAAVFDDVLSLLILGVIAGLGGAGRSSPVDVLFLLVEAVAFVGFVTLVGVGAIRRYGPRLRATAHSGSPFVIAVGICLGLSALASQIGLSPIIGAFLAGMVVGEARAHLNIERSAEPVYSLLVPFFFVVVGTEVDLRPFIDGRLLGLTAGLTVLAIVGKVVGCGLGAWGLGWRRAALIGIGMVPRGEVGLAAVSLGRALNAVPEELFSVIVVLSVLTTVIVPPILLPLATGLSHAARWAPTDGSRASADDPADDRLQVRRARSAPA
jgi:Kef-type K+ transport system membrane component KefB